MAGHEYVPLSTSPGHGEDSEPVTTHQIRSHRRQPGPLQYLRRLAGKPRFFIPVAFGLLLVLSLPILRHRSGYTYDDPLPPLPELPDDSASAPVEAADNPYFHTGEVWGHNDLIAAKLDRCAELGLLRDTADPPEPLSADDEAYAISQGCGTNETTIIILSSIYFGEAFSGTAFANAGESIYAQSIMSTLNRYHYSFMFSSLGWYNHDMHKTMEIYRKYRNNVRAVLADPEQADVCWHYPGQDCLKTEENMDGLPAWRLLSFWYWDDPGNPLGPSFTLSPSPRNDNHFLSFSIEPTCRRLPWVPHAQRTPPQAWLLAKQVQYVSPIPEFSWTLEALAAIQRKLGIRVVGGMANDDEATTEAVHKAGIKNLGKIGKIEFYQQLAKSFVLVGVGRPRISPSPWDALCMGVPFINPILTWDEKHPQNRSSWHAQQWHMTDMDPPYVYSVKAHDLKGLQHAIGQALANPIESYIPDYMQFDYVCDRMVDVLDMDWKSKAGAILEKRRRTGEGELFAL